MLKGSAVRLKRINFSQTFMCASESVCYSPAPTLAHQLVQDVSILLPALVLVLLTIKQNLEIIWNLPRMPWLCISFCLFGTFIDGGHRIGFLSRVVCALIGCATCRVLSQLASKQCEDFPIRDDEIFVILSYSLLKLDFAHLNFITYWSPKYPQKTIKQYKVGQKGNKKSWY